MTLVFDESGDFKGKPGLHAFIVGVSDYPHLVQGEQAKTEANLGLRPLSSAALSAFRIFEWLKENRGRMPLPLVSCHLLLAASDQELKKEPSLVDLLDNPTFDSFMQQAHTWRNMASTHTGNMTLFYFAGHGAQRSRRDHVMLLHDFGEDVGGLLSKAVDTNQLINGMARTPKYPKMAQTQLYFIDACRIRPQAFQKYEELPTGALWDVPVLAVDDERVIPIFYTAKPGRMSFGIRGNQTIFSRALLQCLNGGAAVRQDGDGDQPSWQISAHSLINAIGSHIDAINRAVRGNQECQADGLGRDVPLCRLDGPPPVRVLLVVDPTEAHSLARVTVINEKDQTVLGPDFLLKPHPYSDRIPAGNYTLSARIEPQTPGYRDGKWLVLANPPESLWRVRVLG